MRAGSNPAGCNFINPVKPRKKDSELHPAFLKQIEDELDQEETRCAIELQGKLKRILRNSNGLACKNREVSIECEHYEDARQLFDLLANLP